MHCASALALLGFIGFACAAIVWPTCPSKGQHFFPHPTRCAKFVECHNGVMSEHDCFEGTIFNPVVGFCDFPQNYHCVDVEEPEEGPVGKCPPLNGQYVDFLTDATQCGVYYMCNWGTPIKMNCPAGLHFNPKINVCDYPSAAGCTLGQ